MICSFYDLINGPWIVGGYFTIETIVIYDQLIISRYFSSESVGLRRRLSLLDLLVVQLLANRVDG